MPKRLARRGITRIGELARLDEATLVARYGKIGSRLYRCIRGNELRHRLRVRSPVRFTPNRLDSSVFETPRSK